MTENYSVEQRPSAMPYVLGGAGLFGLGGWGATKIKAVKDWTHTNPIYKSHEDLVTEVNKKDGFIKAVKDAGICSEKDADALREIIEADAKNAKELYNAKKEFVEAYFAADAPKKASSELEAARKEYLSALENKFKAKKAFEGLATDATNDVRTAAQDALTKAENALNTAKSKVDDEASKIAEKIAASEEKTGDALKEEVEKIIGKETDATKKALENSSKKDVIAKLLKGAKNWKFWLVTGGAAALGALLGLVIRPNGNEA